MKDNLEHNDNSFLKGAEVPFKNSKTEIWEELSKHIEVERPTKKKQAKLIKLNFKLASVASIALIFGLAIFLKNYSVVVSSGMNEKFSHILPDNSEVFLNENSSLEYHPYWWSFNREIEFEGEAFFEVEKGKQFTVSSEKGRTTVLGTSFNINSRKEYTVYCKTGKVAVNVDNEKEPILLVPNQVVSVVNGVKVVKQLDDEDEVLNWRKVHLNFESMALNEVFSMLEEIYSVNLVYDSTEFLMLNYSANYLKPSNVESVLDMLSLSFNFNYSIDDGDYLIIKAQ